MTFSVTKSRPFRIFGLYRSSGKHAAPRRAVQRAATPPRRAAHAAPLPRLTGQHTGRRKAA